MKAFWAVCLALSVMPLSASAQYVFNPANADEQGIRYFGSAKDTNGTTIAGAIITLSAENASFVFFTDETGRYHGAIPLDTAVDKVTAKCAKVGFQFIKATRRPGPAGGDAKKPTIQVDCVLRPEAK